MHKKSHTSAARSLSFFLALALSGTAFAQSKNAPPSQSSVAELRALLLSQLRSTHTQPEWFLPLNTAISSLTAEQAKWIPTNASGKINPNANHSVGMIANHILFWDSNALAQLKGEPVKNPQTNDETFNDFDPSKWSKLVRDLNTVMVSLEDLVEHSDDRTLLEIAPTIEHISTHNAYHTGQIFYVRKLQGSWKLDNDVSK
jgi:uncharacterized damage-inducible protein DinB